MSCQRVRLSSTLITRLLFSLLFILGTSAARAGSPGSDPRSGSEVKHGNDHGGGSGGDHDGDHHDGDDDHHGGDDDHHDGDDDHHGGDDDDHGGGGHGHGGDGHGGGDCHQVKVCHVSSDHSFQTLTVDQSVLQSHMSHGDLPGSCSDSCDRLCDDGNPCTVDACDSYGRCKTTHPPVSCDDYNKCTIDSCNPATGCVNTPKSCSDNLFCTVDSCDPMTGRCMNPPVCCPRGKVCNTANGTCQSPSTSGACSTNPCLNAGTCIPDTAGNGFSCQCVSNGGLGETVGSVCECAPGCSPLATGGCLCGLSG